MPRILIHGSGGREHCLGWKLKSQGHEVTITPGNYGTMKCGFSEPQASYDMEVYSMDQDLVDGKSDLPHQTSLIFGPTQKAAMLEGSKLWCKKILGNIPYGKASIIKKLDDIKELGVLKYDALAAGKGVYVPSSMEDLKKTATQWLQDKPFGNDEIFVEQMLEGWESSIFLACNGKDVVYLGSAKDYKRRLDHNKGPNTGGMGAISPHPQEESSWKTLFENYGKQICENLAKENIIYKGFMYLGIMWVHNIPYVLEINVRLGDPETQALLARWDFDVYELMKACVKGEKFPAIKLKPETSICVVGVQKDYPARKEEVLANEPDYQNYFWAGLRPELKFSGRVLAATGMGNSAEEARTQAYEKLKNFPQLHWRGDVGSRG